MRTKVTLVLVFLNLALFFFIFKFERNWRTERAAFDTRKLVLGPEAGDIRVLEITSGTDVIRLERRGENWFLIKPIEWPANPSAVLSLISELVHLEHEASFDVSELKNNNQSLADYGLDQPKLKIGFSSGEPGSAPLTELSIGDPTIGKMLYVLSPQHDRVHVVARNLAETLTLPLERLRSDAILSIPVFAARSISIRTAASSGVSVQLRREGQRWSFESPIRARASAPDTELTINQLNALRVKSFVLTPPAAPPSAAPSLRVTLEGNNRFETLLIGGPVAPTPPDSTATLQTKADVEYYAQLQRPDSQYSVVFTVLVPTGPRSLFELLRNAQEELRDHHVLDFDARAVTAITIAAPNQGGQPELTLQRLDAVAGAATSTAPLPTAAASESPGKEAWQIARFNTGTGSQTLPADRALVQRLIEKLGQLTVKRQRGFQSDAPQAAETENWGFNRPERKVTLTLGGTPPVTLEIGLDAKGDAYARSLSEAPYVYAVDKDILVDTPPTALAWRDRVLRELPAAARITALKITDLAGNTTLVDATFEADGTAKTKLDHAKAVTELLSGLRTLRAQTFLRDSFPEKIAFAGEDRAWRYELAFTVALPGGTGGEQSETRTLKLTERMGGSQLIAGSADLGVTFLVEQPFLDAFWEIANAPHDPGPQLPK